VKLELGGGIGPAMAPLVVVAGADVLVAGAAVFGDREGVAAGMNKLRGSMQPTA
jgi:ribulose-phosphate 3-epimerase